MFGAIMLGLYQREKTGRGGKVGTSLMASGAWANACDLQAQFCNAVFPQVLPGGELDEQEGGTGDRSQSDQTVSA